MREFTKSELDISQLELKMIYVDSIPKTARGKLNAVTSKLQDIPVF